MSSKFNIDGDAVRKLAEILVDTDLSEIEYEDNGSRIYVSRKANIAPVATHVVASSPAAAPLTQQAAPTASVTDWAKHPGAVRSPMVGTAYLSPEPGAPNFIKVGDNITVGQTLLIVEAMKVMNQIKATQAGKVIQILVSDASPIEYDEPLLVIE
ncbi:MAG: acetyl-CoA carboxylase biotin carboxyl carrier protein [Alphaproteobacteria bacterium]|jgi:acetyl-CoA carboxylase biotin carboxyl carrier protein|nr:acetyl-CoA carboxylase biotin carboxyl carrier protein [Alphaproteobacteria bacterium]